MDGMEQEYRGKVLVNRAEERLKQLVAEICQENDWFILALEVMPDHPECQREKSRKNGDHDTNR